MRAKLKLNMDELDVETFNTETVKRPSGTVFGEQCTCYTNCTCPGCPTCDASCNGSCVASCNGTCDASCNGSCVATCGDTCNWCGGTVNDYTCAPYGTCGARICREVP